MLMLFDSHMHMNDLKLINRSEEIIRNANELGVTDFICVGYDFESSKLALEIAQTYNHVYAAIGIHPTNANIVLEEQIEWIKEYAQDELVVAIGEIGLDYYWDKAYKEKQKQLFQTQIEIANDVKKPIIVHMRDSTEDTYEILKKYKNQDTRGVMHCYGGSKESMDSFIKLNMFISLAGPVTFKNARDPKEVAKEINLKNLLIETDSPYLAPVPNRGKTNEPKNLYYIAKAIAEIKGVSIEEIAEATYRNTTELFGINKLTGNGE